MDENTATVTVTTTTHGYKDGRMKMKYKEVEDLIIFNEKVVTYLRGYEMCLDLDLKTMKMKNSKLQKIYDQLRDVSKVDIIRVALEIQKNKELPKYFKKMKNLEMK